MALAGAAAFAQGAFGFPGELDWSFGKVTTPIPLGAPWSQARVELAATPDGGSVVAEGHTVVRYRADGKLETGFGSDGVREVVLPRAVDFEVGDLAVDPEGKVVVIGTATRLRQHPAAAPELRGRRPLPTRRHARPGLRRGTGLRDGPLRAGLRPGSPVR